MAVDPYNRFAWTCPECGQVLTAFMEETVETLRILHVGYHRDERKKYNDLFLFEGQAFDVSSQQSLWWSDTKFLFDMKVDPIGKDERSVEELAARYKSNKGEENG